MPVPPGRSRRGFMNMNAMYRRRMGPATPKGYETEYPTAGSSLPSVTMAACSVGVLVPEPAKSPSAWPRLSPISFTKSRLTAPAHMTPTSAMKLALRPAALVSPRKNCLPYCTPTA